MLSDRALLLKPSPTLALANKARELTAKGLDVVSLTVGEPDWPTFSVANQAAIEAINKGFTKYTAAAGMPELRAEIAKMTSDELGVTYSANQTIVATGAKYAIYALLQMLVNPGEEVLIHSPYWVSYPSMAELAGARVKIVNCGEEENFKLTAPALEKAISANSKVLILCSPSNPTGIAYTRTELAALAAVIKKHPNLFVISDDIYNKLIFTENEVLAPHLLHVAPELREQVIVVSGASKTYSMTGWRVGWALGNEKLMKVTADFLSQSTSNVTSIAQYATLAALKEGDQELKAAVNKLRAKKARMFAKFQSLKKIKTVPPDGAFYFWVDVRGCYTSRLKNSKDIADLLLDKYLLAVVPGIEFGSEGYLRISFAASDADLDKAFERLKKFESELA
jgi:aspartate aminotransferase